MPGSNLVVQMYVLTDRKRLISDKTTADENSVPQVVGVWGEVKAPFLKSVCNVCMQKNRIFSSANCGKFANQKFIKTLWFLVKNGAIPSPAPNVSSQRK